MQYAAHAFEQFGVMAFSRPELSEVSEDLAKAMIDYARNHSLQLLKFREALQPYVEISSRSIDDQS